MWHREYLEEFHSAPRWLPPRGVTHIDTHTHTHTHTYIYIYIYIYIIHIRSAHIGLKVWLGKAALATFCHGSWSPSTNNCWTSGPHFLIGSEQYEQNTCFQCRHHQVPRVINSRYNFRRKKMAALFCVGPESRCTTPSDVHPIYRDTMEGKRITKPRVIGWFSRHFEELWTIAQ